MANSRRETAQQMGNGKQQQKMADIGARPASGQCWHQGKAGISATLASGQKPVSGQGRHQHSAGIGINAGRETALAL
jgi:hypothetical protein